ncbi:hypothetical protein ADK57_41025 [Streptomyces sp. MMG1533]|nr:hypothetical protein ADK57_41025 [Streptomyces sp. MMG1533]
MGRGDPGRAGRHLGGASAARPQAGLPTIGLDLGARTAEETAISITAEIIAPTHHGTGRSLSNGTGPIHPAHDRPLATEAPHFLNA